jgi:hypothetical protein
MSTGGEVDLQPKIAEAGPIALELMKQLITLSSGVLALSAAFLDKFRVSHSWEYLPLIISWVLLIASLITALNVISAMVQSRLKPEREWHTGRAKLFGRISKIAFVLGISSFGLFALLATWSTTAVSSQETGQGVVVVNGKAGPIRYRLIPDSSNRLQAPTASSSTKSSKSGQKQ